MSRPVSGGDAGWVGASRSVSDRSPRDLRIVAGWSAFHLRRSFIRFRFGFRFCVRVVMVMAGLGTPWRIRHRRLRGITGLGGTGFGGSAEDARILPMRSKSFQWIFRGRGGDFFLYGSVFFRTSKKSLDSFGTSAHRSSVIWGLDAIPAHERCSGGPPIHSSS
ncbi:hypothetical protein FNV43_RR10278 [Rhamnella rubrinervis]|uniref:Uncharacterized protein n=1 Tax=Rhamnella rubrinervis TaxID=2594499 RepID=A0A8K0HCW3_9ROSA|nr:hypothetical protein FNV43_RR10278 [Rhamnella rubrinervis]